MQVCTNPRACSRANTCLFVRWADRNRKDSMGKLETLITLGSEMVDDWHAKRADPNLSEEAGVLGDALAGYLQEIIDTISGREVFIVTLTSAEGGSSYEAFFSLDDAAKQAREWAEAVGITDGANADGDTVDVFCIDLTTLNTRGVPLDELPQA